LNRSSPRSNVARHTERIPFYRNVKTIGVLVQLIFVVAAAAGLYFLWRNVTTGLEKSNLTFGFGFLDDRAGFDLGETTIPFSSNDSYLKAIAVGMLNTLKVGLAGVALCSILGVSVGVMRLSTNWLLRTLSTAYVELLRNTPLAVQLIFWYYAIILAIPPRSENAIRIFGDFYFSQIGIAMPWLYPSYNFGIWLPWLVAALVVLSAGYLWRRRQIARSQRPGNPWSAPLLVAAAIAGAGYLISLAAASTPEGLAAQVSPSRGVGVVYLDSDGDGSRDRNERRVPRAPVVVSIPEARLQTNSTNLIESKQIVYSTFRFPRLSRNEFEDAEVVFREPEEAEGLSIHFERYPSIGTIYRDENGNGEFDEGEQTYLEDGLVRGYNGIGLAMNIEGFRRRLVSDRLGELRMPIFIAPETEDADAGGNRAGGLAGGLGGLFRPTQRTTGAIETGVALPAAGPLVYSAPTIPRSSYFGGQRLSTPFLALLLGLAIYTSAFVAEIVRGGIQAIPRGQPEAAKALGLSGGQTFFLVVFPQALRIIIPPMISQYLNLIKNSSLAILVTFSDFFQVSNTVGNQTGQFISVYVIILIGYLGLSLVFSLLLNIVNDRLALVER
jgi:His/Glu/Gln/Arg/opine family amino acid ABC transporter permease subunit